MSMPPNPPGGAPYGLPTQPYAAAGTPAAYAMPPKKPRPSGWWFVIGSGLVVGGVVIFAVMIVVFAHGIGAIDKTVSADGTAQQVHLATTGKKLIWGQGASGSQASCTVTDANGTRLPVSQLGDSSFDRSSGSSSWSGVGSFTTTTNDVTMTCTSGAGTIQVGGYPSFGRLGAALGIGILALVVLGLAGGVILLVTTILFITRPSRKTLAIQSAGSGPQPYQQY